MTHPAKAYWADRTQDPPLYAKWDGEQWLNITETEYQRLIEGLKE